MLVSERSRNRTVVAWTIVFPLQAVQHEILIKSNKEKKDSHATLHDKQSNTVIPKLKKSLFSLGIGVRYY